MRSERPQLHDLRRTCTVLPQPGQGLYQVLVGLAAASLPAAFASGRVRFSRAGSERSWLHCGCTPDAE